jgi:AcrR family transcriptional regulator
MKPLIGSKWRVITTEKKILDASNFIFLQYGYHGTTIQTIAKKADVNKSMVHYYFRSKDNLYRLAIKYAFDQILNVNKSDEKDNEITVNSSWFIKTELHNNKVVFLQIVEKLYSQDFPGVMIKLAAFSNNVI